MTKPNESNRVLTGEEKMKIVIDNYFKTECNVDTSIREAFEKGFRIGAIKRKHGYWIRVGDNSNRCSVCNEISCCQGNYCPDCGSKMNEDF